MDYSIIINIITNDQTTSFQKGDLTKSLSFFHLKMDPIFKICFKKLMVTNSVQNNTIFIKI
jgi:hypothetical protein